MMGMAARAQSSAAALDVVSWNVEWFGSAANGPADKNLQEANVRKILRALNADLYGLVEVVDTVRLKRVVDSLGSDYRFVVSPFCSGNTSGTGAAWLAGQKLAFVYNRNVFSNVRTRGLLRTSNNAYTNFASGRFPFMLTADVQLDGVYRAVNFILIHAKAGSTPSDYDRRLGGAQELKDTLDAQFASSYTILLGDFNDALNTTICNGCGTTVSSYDPIVKDSLDSDHYRSLTLPLANAGQSSMTSFPNVVDNHVISNELEEHYLPLSTLIRKDVAALVNAYGSTTSDHYPVFSQYRMLGPTALLTAPAEEGLQIYPNPFAQELLLLFRNAPGNVQLRLMDVTGRVLYQQLVRSPQAAQAQRLSLPSLPPGLYYLQVQTARSSRVFTLAH